jgi:hypothetical protein
MSGRHADIAEATFMTHSCHVFLLAMVAEHGIKAEDLQCCQS